MDPNATLDEILSLSANILFKLDNNQPIDVDDAERLSELTIALNNWIVGGGFLPDKWEEARIQNSE